MELGEKLRQARQEAGMSQRELCGEQITRNMLSLIENGAASPSVKTLQYLAGQLGKPVSYFLEDGLAETPNHVSILSARRCFDAGDWAGVLGKLEKYQVPDGVFDRERDMLWVQSCLNLAEEAIKSHRNTYARELLELSKIPTAYFSEAVERRRELLLGELGLACRLPELDRELRIRSRQAEKAGDFERALALLEAMEARSPEYYLEKGKILLELQKYAEAAKALERAEEQFPKETVPRLERAYRQLGDYQKAYEYAVKGRD